MPIKSKKSPFWNSIEEVSILRKFAILFLLTSISPMSLLYYAYVKGIKIDTIAMILMVLGVLVGYFAARSLLVRAISIAKENRKTLEPFLSPSVLKELNAGENELMVLNSTFAAVIKQLETNIRDLQTKNAELQSLDQLKDEFVNTVSHEFRSPLTIIQESIRQIAEGLFGEINQAQMRYFNISLKNIDRLKALINNMLDIAKIEKGKFEIIKKNVDVVDLIRDVVNDFSVRMVGKNVELKSELPSHPVVVLADKDKIIQVLINLVSNAYKFTEKGQIKVSLREAGKFIECSVEDTGIGIAQKDIPLLFSKFHQIGRSQGLDQGTGLGLVIAKNIIELHNGQVIVESQEGVGSKFTITLPNVVGESKGKENHGEKNINSR
jgi:signal transduction histidine kinase